MNKLARLIKQIEQLSGENRTKVGDYIAYLIWQEEQRHLPEINSWSYSLVEAFKGASVYASQDPAGMDVKLAQATVGGVAQPALWAHPPLLGQAIIEYHVPVPQQISNIQLHLSFGIRDGAQISDDNLIAFSVRLNGIRVWGQQTNAQQWQPATIPLDVPAGDMVRLELATETLGSHEWTWAVWGTPEMTGKGNKAA